MESGIIETAGAEIYYQSHGEGPAVVLAHGIGGNHAIWFKQIAQISKSNRVIVFDHRGFGRSHDLDGRGRSAFVMDLVSLLDHLKIEKVALVGQSMGAGTCIGFAQARPDRTAALAICDSLHGIVESAGVKAIMDEARKRTSSLDQIDRVLGAAARERNPDVEILYRQIASFNLTDRRTLVGEFQAVPSAELVGKGFPVLFLCGQDDILFPVEAIRLAQQEAIGSFMIEISDAGHSAFLEQSTQFNDTILTLLQMAGHVGGKSVPHSNAPGYVPVAS